MRLSNCDTTYKIYEMNCVFTNDIYKSVQYMCNIYSKSDTTHTNIEYKIRRRVMIRYVNGVADLNSNKMPSNPTLLP